MDNYIVQLNDDLGGFDRKVYITSWGTSPWLHYAKSFYKNEAKQALTDFLNNNQMGIITGNIIKHG